MKSYDKKELAVIALDALYGVEYKYEKKILDSVKNPEDLFKGKAFVEKVLAECFSEVKANTVAMSLTAEFADSVVKSLDKRGVTAITCYSKEYPERLKNVDSPPLVLYCVGNIDLLNESKILGAVGSRKTLPYAEELLKNVVSTVVKAGATIVTGSATGADKAAISASLESGKIISVLTGGIDHVYPECNRSIIEKVAKRGLVISEQAPSVAPTYWMFPVRNRIIAGLSDAVLIASGDKKSGARHTADFALNYGRQVFAFPYSVGIKSGELCNDLIKNGAALCDGYQDILDELGLSFDETEEEVLELDEEEKKLYDAISNGMEDMTKYCMQHGVRFVEIAPTISSLEIQGLIVKTAGNRYKPVK